MSAQKIPKKRTAAKKEEDDDPFFDDDSDDEPVGRVNKPRKKSNFSSDGPSPSKYDTALPPPPRDEHKPRWEQDERRDAPPPRPRASIFAEPPRPSALRGRSPPKREAPPAAGSPAPAPRGGGNVGYVRTGPQTTVADKPPPGKPALRAPWSWKESRSKPGEFYCVNETTNERRWDVNEAMKAKPPSPPRSRPYHPPDEAPRSRPYNPDERRRDEAPRSRPYHPPDERRRDDDRRRDERDRPPRRDDYDRRDRDRDDRRRDDRYDRDERRRDDGRDDRDDRRSRYDHERRDEPPPRRSRSRSRDRKKKKKKRRERSSSEEAPPKRKSRFSAAPPAGYAPPPPSNEAAQAAQMPDVGKALEMARQLALQKANAGNALSLQGMLGANPEPGKVYRAVVERCQTFGAFCKTEPEGFTGMIHTSEFGIREFRRYEGPQDVEAVVPPGSRVYVLCKEIKDGNKVALSLDGVNQENGTYDITKTKRYQNDNARDKPPPAVGSIHRGAVKRIESYGAFVTLEGFSDGMVHVSQLSRSQRFYDARDIEQAFPLGGPIFVQVVQVKEGNRVELSAQDVDQATGQALPPRHQHQGPRGTLPDVGVVLRGQVKRLEGYGVFVALPPPHNMDGLVHVSRIHPEGARLNDAGDVAQFAPVGAEVYVFVQGYKDGGKLELSMARVDQATGQLKPEAPRPPPMPSHGMIDPYAPSHGMVDPYAQMAQFACGVLASLRSRGTTLGSTPSPRSDTTQVRLGLRPAAGHAAASWQRAAASSGLRAASSGIRAATAAAGATTSSQRPAGARDPRLVGSF